MLTWDDVKGVGPARRAALEQAGFFTPEQLAQRLPVGYRDTRNVTPLAELRAGMETAFEGIVAPQARPGAAGKAELCDGAYRGREWKPEMHLVFRAVDGQKPAYGQARAAVRPRLAPEKWRAAGRQSHAGRRAGHPAGVPSHRYAAAQNDAPPHRRGAGCGPLRRCAPRDVPQPLCALSAPVRAAPGALSGIHGGVEPGAPPAGL